MQVNRVSSHNQAFSALRIGVANPSKEQRAILKAIDGCFKSGEIADAQYVIAKHMPGTDILVTPYKQKGVQIQFVDKIQEIADVTSKPIKRVLKTVNRNTIEKTLRSFTDEINGRKMTPREDVINKASRNLEQANRFGIQEIFSIR